MTAKLLETLTLAEVALMDVFDYDNVKQALAAIREAKAELEKQEPVAWRAKDANSKYMYGDLPAPELPFDQPKLLYAAPVPVTTPDVCGEVCARAKLCYGCNKNLEEANAKYAEQAEQEPVAWVNADQLDNLLGDRTATIEGNRSLFRATPLYAAPVQQAEREPVALLQLAADALVYHTEQTRPIQNTIDVLAAIQKFKEKQR